MHANLDLAIEKRAAPDSRESELIALHSPPLNLAKCRQTAQHRRISEARAAIMASLTRDGCPPLPNRGRRISGADLLNSGTDEQVETANEIAARFKLDPNSYRKKLRAMIAWYSKPQVWTFPVNSREWQDMIAVALSMAGRAEES
jgi:hypothetical protein